MNAPVEAGLAQALAALGLRTDADARAVRRAYALQLKQIDQATQLQEFQALREAYEFALNGIARREAQLREEAPPDEPEAPAPPVARPATGFAPPDSAELARAVFQPFAARAAAGFKDEPDATAALQDALADERLLNLEARTLFELQVAHLLMGGWQPGHEFLFGPACELLSWEKDRAHLRVFGQMGAALDAAINEKLIFFRQAPHDFELQRNVIRRLRQADMPAVATRRADLPLVQMLVQRYPNWLRLITSQANINSWFVDLVGAPAGAGEPPPPQPAAAKGNQGSSGSTLPWFMFVMLVIGLVRMLSSAAPERTYSPAAQPAFDATAAGPKYDTSWKLPGDATFGSIATDAGLPSSSSPGSSSRERPPAVLIPAPPQRSQVDQASETAPPNASAPPPAEAPALAQSITSTAAATTEAAQPPTPPVHEAKPPPSEQSRLGHVTLALRDNQIVVEEVRERTRFSFGTLQSGDRVLGCVSSDHRQPLAHPYEARKCVATVNVKAEAGATVYMFRVMRYGTSMPASLTLRDEDALEAPSLTSKIPAFGSQSQNQPGSN